MANTRDVVAAYWSAADARDWDTFADLIADNIVYEGPQTRERVTGKEAYLRFNMEGFPGDWHLTVERLVADGAHAATWIDMVIDGQHLVGLAFFDLDDAGRISRITDYWPDPYELPASRAHLVERY